jgi:hypothetical protein
MKARTVTSFLAVVLGLAMFIPVARADERDQETRFTFDNAIELPSNVMLPAGTYWFRLADCMSAPCNAVEIRDVNKKHIVTIQTQATERNMPLDDKASVNGLFTQPVLNVAEGTDAVQLVKWFYPGDQMGHKFVYSGSQERALSEGGIVTLTVPTPRHQHVFNSNTLTVSNDESQ